MMHKSLANKFYLLIVGVTLGIGSVNAATTFETKAKQAYMICEQTGTVLFELNADQLMAPSSMTKIMTAYMLFERLVSGEVNLDDEFPVSQLAWRKGGSKMFVEVGTKVRVEDLIRGMIIQSGNDACIVLAEALAGNEGVFAAEMTKRAKELGATNTTFKNSTGWPDPLHVSTARDLALIANRIREKFPDLYHYFSEPDYTYGGIYQKNRNTLIEEAGLGVDGLKTGSTDAGGYGMVVSAVQNGMRLTLVVNGLKSASERAYEAKALLMWGFRNFATPCLFKKGEEVVKTNVWLGNKPQVPVVVDKDVYITMPREAVRHMKVEAIYDEPIDVSRIGQIVGKIIINIPDRQPVEVPLRAMGDVQSANFFSRIKAAVYYLVLGHNDEQSS